MIRNYRIITFQALNINFLKRLARWAGCFFCGVDRIDKKIRMPYNFYYIAKQKRMGIYGNSADRG